jgi:NAD+ synthase
VTGPRSVGGQRRRKARDCLPSEHVGRRARLTAVRLPYGVQLDEADAQTACAVIDPDNLVTVDIKGSVDAMHAQTTPEGYADVAQGDFGKGNLKARARMMAQDAIAGHLAALVVGTDHAAEAVMGFFTKYGDGRCDVTPLAGLTERGARDRQASRSAGSPGRKGSYRRPRGSSSGAS